MTVCWDLGLTVRRLTEKPQTVKAKRPDDRLLIIGEVEMNSGEQKLLVLHFGNQLTKISI